MGRRHLSAPAGRGPRRSLKKEVDEFVEAINAEGIGRHASVHMELADILLLLLGIASKMKVSAESLVECGYIKLEKIKRRQHWEQLPDGSFHHVEPPEPRASVVECAGAPALSKKDQILDAVFTPL